MPSSPTTKKLPAALAALIAGSLANLLFTRPYGSLTISQPENAFALVVFVVVGVTVASVVDRSAVRGQACGTGPGRGAAGRRRRDQRGRRDRSGAGGAGAGQGRFRHAVRRAAVDRGSAGQPVDGGATGAHGRTRRADRGGRLGQPGHRRRGGDREFRLDARAVRQTVDARGPRAGRGVRRAGGAGHRTGAADPRGRAG